MRKPEVDFGHLPQSLTTLFSEAGSLTEPQLVDSDTLSGRCTLVIFLSPPPSLRLQVCTRPSCLDDKCSIH